MNLFDVGVVALLIIAIVLGYRSGALPQIGGLGGAILGGGLAILALPVVELAVRDLDPWPRAIVVLAWLLLSIGIGEAAGSGVGRYGAYRLRASVLGTLDRVAGAGFGAAQAILIVWLGGGLLAVGPVPRLAAQAQTSTSVRTLAGVFPPPTEIAVELGHLLDSSGLPDVFVGLEPIPAPPVERPSDPRAQAIAASAAESTGRVTAQACNHISSGTGFVVSAGYVMTNAHVVAGGGRVRITIDRTYDAEVVLFDPDLDVALLHVPRLGARALDLAPTDPGRGATGAAIGFPGGGSMTAIPVAVAARYQARGRDIYGRGLVTRDILELRAAIEPGDSGGPFILTDGTIGGMVFAESRSDESVGYALTPSEVAGAIGPAIGSTRAVDTGACIN